jgi:hypothetical protein
MGKSMDMLEGSCSQNTLKNKSLEHQSYRQERNFIGRERLSGQMHSRVQKLGAPEHGRVELFMYVRLLP